MKRLETEKSIIVGMKQTLRALEMNLVCVLYIALDADEKVTSRIEELAIKKQIEIVKVPTMRELGDACNVRIGASTCAIVKN